MKNICIKNNLILMILFNFCYILSNFDVAIIGIPNFADGLGRLPIVFNEMLKDKIKIRKIDFNILKENNIINDEMIQILFDLLSHKFGTPASLVNGAGIKISYSMLESTAIPNVWVELLNNKFDMVVVPDSFLKKVYESCGVTIPIFVLPCPMHLTGFLQRPIKNKVNKIFTFGMSNGHFTVRKNHDLLISAFLEEFENDKNVKLKVHWQPTDNQDQKAFLKKIIKLQCANIELINRNLKQDEYVKFLSSLDCYILLSLGEGFSNTPREALALGIPCIISNNTAHRTICNTGFVLAIESNILKRAYYNSFDGYSGYNFDCSLENVKIAMRKMYQNYQTYLSKAQLGKKWVKQFELLNVKPLYLNLIKPKTVIFGKENILTKDYIMTSSEKLYKKYIKW